MEKRVSIDVLYEIAISRLREQIKRVDGLDARLGAYFGLTNGITAALVAFTVFVDRPITQPVQILASLTFASYVVTLVFLYFAYQTHRRWSYRPSLSTLREICTDPQYHDYPQTVKRWVALQCTRSIEWNELPLIHKARQSYRPLVTLSAQGAFLAAACICYLLN